MESHRARFPSPGQMFLRNPLGRNCHRAWRPVQFSTRSFAAPMGLHIFRIPSRGDALQGHTTMAIPLWVRNRTAKTQEISFTASCGGMGGAERYWKIHGWRQNRWRPRE